MFFGLISYRAVQNRHKCYNLFMKSKRRKELSRPTGRPLSFDPDKALDRALDVFWRKGYEGASLADLTKAMGINRPSLYAAFGDKEKLFRKVLDRYAEGPASYSSAALEEPTSRAVVERLLYGTADMLTCLRAIHVVVYGCRALWPVEMAPIPCARN